MDPQAIARDSLHADAGYCAGVGAGLVVLSRPIGRVVDVPPWAVRAAGFGVVGWAALVEIMARGGTWRRPTALVMAANAGTSAGLAVWAATHGRPRARRLLVIAAAQVGAFAVVQGVALASGRTST